MQNSVLGNYQGVRQSPRRIDSIQPITKGVSMRITKKETQRMSKVSPSNRKSKSDNMLGQL